MRKFSTTRLVLAATGSIMALAQVTEAYAQIDEIIVTANRRDESAQNVPISVAAVDEDLAKKLGIVDMRSLATLVPGLAANRVGIFPVTFIRGIGTTSTGPTIETAIASYVDDVYIPSSPSSALSSFLNINRIEVLKGPQGTLFGRNATGGVIQVFTKDPTPDPAMDISVGYGNYNTLTTSLYATSALTSKLSANIALNYSNQFTGWGRNLVDGGEVNKTFSAGGRVKFLLQPTDQTSIRLAVDYSFVASDTSAINRPATGTRTALGFLAAPDFYDSTLDTPSNHTNKQEGVSLKVKHDMDWASLVSISAYRYNRGMVWFDNDYGPTRTSLARNWYKENTFTQELQLLSPESAPFKWLVGLYYFDDKGGADPNVFMGSSIGATRDYIKAWGVQSSTSYSGFGQATVPITPKTNLTGGLRYTIDRRHIEMSSAIKLASSSSEGPRTPVANSPLSKTWYALTSRISLDHHFTDDVMGYIAYNRGFRSGTFNPQQAPGTPIAPAVNPEKLDSYTIGLKADFLNKRLRVNTEGFYYTFKDLQLQQTLAAGSGVLIVNAAAATVYGIDIDVTAQPTENLTLTGSFQLLEAEYDSYPNGLFNVYNPAGGNCTFTVVPGGPVPCGGRALPPNFNPTTGTWDLKGNRLVHSPPYSVTLSANYVIPSKIGPFDVNFSWSHTASYYADGDNGLGQVPPSSQDKDRQQALNLLSASVGWTAPGGTWEVRAWGHNLIGEEYWSVAIENPTATRNNAAEPRTYGVVVTAHF